jgi:hypothetical protein
MRQLQFDAEGVVVTVVDRDDGLTDITIETVAEVAWADRVRIWFNSNRLALRHAGD